MKKFSVIAGNCVIESEETTLETADFLDDMRKKYGFELIYKSSWTKDNRSSADSFSGLDIPECYEIFKELKERGFTTLTDVHSSSFIDNYYTADILQLPAYLCMQTSIIRSLASTRKPINIKKGQFLSPYDVKHIIDKFKYYNKNINLSITERGTCFGYRDLVVDPRSLQILKEFGYPVFLDVGHSIRKYGIPSKDKSGGNKEFINTLGKVGAVLGCNIFVEVHPNPKNAKCDAATQINFKEFENLIKEVTNIWKYS